MTPATPSEWAIRQVRDPLPIPKTCHLCGGDVTLCENGVIYGRSYGGWPWVYHCSGCGAYVGLHPHTDIPMGTLAAAETRKARQDAKAMFIRWIERFGVDRSVAYRKLARKMGMVPKECHFGWFGVKDCEKAERAITELWKET